MVLSTRVTEIPTETETTQLITAAEKTEKEGCSDGYSTGMWKEVVDKQSITNTSEETCKKFEV